MILGLSLWKYVEKIFPNWRWHYSASWGTGQIQIWPIEVPKTSICMISGFLQPPTWEPLFVDLNIPNYFDESKKIKNHLWNTLLSNKSNLGIWHFRSWDLRHLKLLILQLWNFGTWTFWNFETLQFYNFELCCFETLKIWNVANQPHSHIAGAACGRPPFVEPFVAM